MTIEEYKKLTLWEKQKNSAELVYKNPKLFEFVPVECKTNEVCYSYLTSPYREGKDVYHLTYEGIPPKFLDKQMWEVLVLSPIFRSLAFQNIKAMPKEFITDDFVVEFLKGRSVFEPNYKRMGEIKELLNQNICNIIVKERIECLPYVPAEFVNDEMINGVTNFNYLPQKYRTKERCMDITKRNLSNFNYLVSNFKFGESPEDQTFIDELVNIYGSGIIYGPIKKFLTSKHYEKILSSKPVAGVFNQIPEDKLNDKIWEIYIVNNPNILSFKKFENVIPKKFFSDDFIVKLATNHPNVIRSIPKELISKDAATRIVEINPDFIKYMPKKHIDDDLKKNQKISRLKDSKEIIIGLSHMLESGGSIQKLSSDLGMPITKIESVIEGLQYTEPDLYQQIKKKMDLNQKAWYHTRLREAEYFKKLIDSLGKIDGNFLSKDQKIKFIYLYNTHIRITIEELYGFVSDYADRIQNSKEILQFVNRVFKYRRLKNDIMIGDEKKSIEHNNQWVKSFNIGSYFGIVDSKSTVTNRIGENVVKEADVRSTMDVLKENGIPLNDMIVKKAIQSFYDSKLDDFVKNIKSYDIEVPFVINSGIPVIEEEQAVLR